MIGGRQRPASAGWSDSSALDGGDSRIRAVAIGFVDHEDVGNLHDPRLQCLHVVASARDDHHDGNIRSPDDLDLVLADADGFDDDDVVP